MDKQNAQPTTVEAYIAAFPDEVRQQLNAMRNIVCGAAPNATETISYQLPTLVLRGRNLIHFGAFKNHIGLYPGAAAVAAFDNELSAYKWAKGSIQFPAGKPLPEALINRIVSFCVEENLKKKEVRKVK
jgi:uncharacterized protein YdhG (YjbR/CyaY superfamily)